MLQALPDLQVRLVLLVLTVLPVQLALPEQLVLLVLTVLPVQLVQLALPALMV